MSQIAVQALVKFVFEVWPQQMLEPLKCVNFQSVLF